MAKKAIPFQRSRMTSDTADYFCLPSLSNDDT